jgi:hypothetical protein
MTVANVVVIQKGGIAWERSRKHKGSDECEDSPTSDSAVQSKRDIWRAQGDDYRTFLADLVSSLPPKGVSGDVPLYSFVSLRAN